MTHTGAQRVFASLRRFTGSPAPASRCDLCSLALDDAHAHLLDPQQRTLVCACRACALLFAGSRTSTQTARYLRIEPRAQRLPEVHFAEHEWHALDLPVRLVFLCPSAVHARVFALYPNPAGATEAQVPGAAWDALVVAHRVLAGIRPDVEALIVDGRAGRCICHAVSIDVCHRLLGIVRADANPRAGAWRELEHALLELERGAHA